LLQEIPVGLQLLSVGQRLVAGFLLVVLAMVALTGLGVSRVADVNNGLSVINEQNSVKQRYAIN
jgi:methyl-accepting chemotaxis protein